MSSKLRIFVAVVVTYIVENICLIIATLDAMEDELPKTGYVVCIESGLFRI